MKRPMVLLSLMLCLQGCMAHPLLHQNQDPVVAADAVAHEGSGSSDLPTPPAKDAKNYFKTFTIVAGTTAVVVGVAAIATVLVVMALAKTPTNNPSYGPPG